MNPKIKNAIVFIGIGLVMVTLYFVFIKKSPEEANLVTPNANTINTAKPSSEVDMELAKDFLGLLLSVKDITLNENIFSDPAFKNLRDSSILLVPDGSEGRPNPFAPLGVDVILQGSAASASLNAFSTPTSTTTTGSIDGELPIEDTVPVDTNLQN